MTVKIQTTPQVQMIAGYPVNEQPQRLARVSPDPLAIDFPQLPFQIPRKAPGDEVQGRCMHHLFEAQAVRTPAAIALCWVDAGASVHTMTYDELNAHANQLAHHLQALGVGPEVLVGLCVERSLEMIVALLAILKAGGAYVPLDPTYPQERLAFMVQDADIAVLVTQSHLQDRLPSTRAARVYLDPGWPQLAPARYDNVASQVQPDNVAYVIYTSGSTGQPKGVVIEHGTVWHLAQAQRQLFGVHPGDRILQFASLNFDASVWEILMAFAAGATLYVAPTAALLPGAPLTTLLQTHAITHVTLVPAVLATLSSAELPALQTVIVAGEACPAALAHRWQADRRFFNAYGPTEATVCATIMPCPPHALFTVAPPIGLPLAHVQLYILDEQAQPVAPGDAGELYIGGAGLARGYLNRPTLTTERFLPNPWGQGRLYKTGDLVRQLPDGVLDFLGRIDHQVKLRGFRIELGEIEACLRQHPALGEAVVTVQERRVDDKRLIAYVTPKAEIAPLFPAPDQLIQSVRAYLGQQLPDYMVPAAFVVLAALPLTLNGKVDRNALPAPDVTLFASPADFAPAQTATEEVVAAIWSEVLGLPQIGRNADFFESGGHSLLAIQVISRLRAHFAAPIDLRTLFATPTLAELARLLDQHVLPVAPALPPLTAVGKRPVTLPLSYAQQRLWFLDQFEQAQGATVTYNVPFALHLHGSLDIDALQAALATIGQRHEVLRTTFAVVDGVAQQIIAPTFAVTLPLIDLQPLPDPAAALQQHLQAEARQPFDLATGPLLRTLLYRLQATEYVLSLTCHHIVIDGWSLGVLLSELAQCYAAARRGEVATLAPLPLQYADFALWQRQWLQGASLEAQRAYWRKQLAAAPTLLALPTDYPRPPVQRFHGGTVELTIDAALTAALQRVSQQHAVSLFMTLYAAFAVLLARYSGQEDLVIGTTVANRQHRELEPLIGFFVNTLPLRVNVGGNLTFGQLLQRVRQLTLDAYAHQDIPFEQLVSDVLTERTLQHSPLFQVMLTFDNTNSALPQMSDLTVAPLRLASIVAKFDLTLQLTAQDGALQGALEYNCDLFARPTIERLATHLQVLLTALATDPTLPIQQAPLLSAAERQQVVTTWNNTATAYPQDQTIHQLFAQQAVRTPDAVAVCLAGGEGCGPKSGVTLTYRELNERADQLACYLQSQGVGPETLVALCVERSLEMLIGILGILKAGGAYVPLDPAYPQARLAFMLADTASPLILTQAKLRSVLPANVPTLCLDTEWAKVAVQAANPQPQQATAENLAYVMYTSGSTGQPKGVCVTHCNVVRLVKNTNFAQLNAEEVFLQLAPISFDAATLEIWAPLLNGGRLVLMPPGQPSLQALGAVIRHHGVTTLWLPAGLFHLIVDEDLPLLQPLRQLLAGGDVLSVAHVQRFLQALPHCRLINGYGPTENTTFTCCYTFPPDVPLAASAPIGQPLANTQVYLLDKQMQPVPIGIPGELYTGGDGVARGYLNRPELTADRFVANPFGAGRLYKSGDLARWRPDGTIEFLGRIDQQVKIRGFRIELGEIETLLTRHPQVLAALVMVREDTPGDKQLVAYVVRRPAADYGDGPQATPLDLRAYLATQLPAYMLPSAFVELPAFPLTPNGKVDRKALPAPMLLSVTAQPTVQTQTPTEEVLAAIWAAVLGQAQVGRLDNFFHIGGHSLLATQIVARVRQAFALDIPLRMLFEAPTIAELGKVIEQQRQASAGNLVPPITVADPSAPLPLSYAQQRLWFLDQLEGPSATYTIPLLLRLSGPLEQHALQAALQALVQRHAILRTHFPAVNGIAQQVIAAECSLPLMLVELPDGADQAAELQRQVQAMAWAPFDLANGPLIRATLYRLQQTEHCLLLTLHHILADGWSLGILLQELTLFYQAAQTGMAAPVAPLAIQYGDFALWQRTWWQGDRLAGQRAYWQQQLAHAPTLLTLPTDYPRPPVQTFNGAMVTYTLDPALTAAVQQVSQTAAVSLFMTFYAAFAVLLARYSGQDDLVIGTPIANRQQPEVEPLIGFFANTLPLRVTLADNPTFADLLQRVRHLTLDAYAHQDLPFEQLVSDLAVERTLSHSPLFQVMLAFNTMVSATHTAANLTLTPVELESVVAKFDLTLHLTPNGDTWQARLEYNRDLFARSTIERLGEHFCLLLEAFSADPSVPIQQALLLTAAEQRQLLIDWNQTATPYPQDKTIQQLFEAQVERTPDAYAVIFDGGAEAGDPAAAVNTGTADDLTRYSSPATHLTYRELNARANQLAHYLQTQGVRPGTLVGICVERSLEMVIGILGILKAGGAYVPLDPTYPQERLAFVLEETNMHRLLTQQHLLTHFSSATVQPICLDRDWAHIAHMSIDQPLVTLRPTDLAYIIYTSGSTGRPKGVMVNHQNLVHSTTARFHTYAKPVECFLLLSSLAFDSSVAGIFWSLCQGGTLLLPQPGAEKDVQALAHLISRHKITHLLCLPALYDLLLTYTNPAQLASLQVAIVAGEACPPQLPSRHTACLPNATLYNEYGPTEGSVWSTVYQVPADWQGTQVPIGQPIPNMQVYILDRYLQPVPVGVSGELYIGGAGITSGYWQRPELTLEKFIDFPGALWELGADGQPAAFHPKSQPQKLYRTGDLVRYLPDGNIEFLGRIDQQVKIRGFRIELGEIEMCLAQHPHVQEAIVVAYPDANGQARLAAYVVTKDEAPMVADNTLPAQLRAFLQPRLPDYMVPALFMRVDAFPVTPNGKVDRKALPAPTMASTALSAPFTAPRNLFETLLADIWQALLNVPHVGVHDNFFELGGHSLLMAQLAAQIRLAFQIDFSLRTLFLAPTLEAMSAAILEEMVKQTDADTLTAILHEL